jgi:nucleotide-binding universal stress UspA family protein
MTVLCGTDFSPPSEQAERAAVALATRLRARLHLVHAIERPHPAAAPTEEGRAARVPLEEKLAGKADTLRRGDLLVTTEILTALAPDALSEKARELGARVLVVASGRGRDAKGTRSTVAERCAQQAAAPVVVVRSAEPFEAFARGDRPLRVLLGLELSEAAEAALSFVKALRGAGPCEVVVAHAYWTAGEKARLGLKGVLDLTSGDPEVERILTRDLEHRLGNFLREPGVCLRLKGGLGAAAPQLCQLAEEEKADLTVIGTAQRKGTDRVLLGSVTEAILKAAPCGVACVPARWLRVRDRRLPPLRRVLLPTDLSELGNLAIPFGFALAGQGGTVHLAHVVSPGATVLPTAGELAGRLRELIPVQADALGTRVTVELLEGKSVVELLCQAAERLGVDAICMASHGRTGASKLLMGSIAEGVLAASRKPTMVIRPPRTD